MVPRFYDVTIKQRLP